MRRMLFLTFDAAKVQRKTKQAFILLIAEAVPLKIMAPLGKDN